MYKTRRILKPNPGCFDNVAPVDGYLRFTCGPGVEAIGQARAIKYLSDHLESPSQGLISPNVQWEMYLPGNKRPDIFVYDRANPAAGVDVIEAKVKGENADYAQWGTQVDGYVQQFTQRGMVNVRRGNTLNRWGAYADEFLVRDTNKACTSTGGTGYIWRTYKATSPQSGLLSIEEVRDKRTCSEEKPPTSSNPQPPVLIAVPDTLPEVISTVAEDGGLAGDVAAAGGPEAAAADLIAELEVMLGGADGSVILAEAGFITVEAALGAGAVAILLFALWYLIHHGGLANGDPHMTTVDGLHYDLQSAGEFTLAHSDTYGMDVQGRFTPLSSSSSVSTISRVAMEVNEHRVEFTSSQLFVDGQVRSLGYGKILSLGEGGYVIHDPNGGYLVLWRGVGGPVLSWKSGSAGLWVPPSQDGDLTGLFGNGDGNPDNDLRLADGTQLPADTSPTVLHSDFADSWRISADESLFTYADGQDTSTFTDLTFPSTITTVHDLTPDQVSLASAQCETAGVAPGPAFNSCVLDLALTANTDFATAAAQQQNITYDPTARGVDAAGDLSVNFESSSLPSNLLPARVSTDPGTTAFAGPFSGTDAYRFYVQSLPSHLQGTLSFNLLTIGDWTTGTDTKSVTVSTDRQEPYTIKPQSLTPASTGTLASSVRYAVYRVTVPFTHADSQAEFKVSAMGVTGIADQAFGVDDVALHIDVVPPQTFATSLPFSVSDGTPAAGAGNLENGASEDDYTFAVTAGASLFIDPHTCPGGTRQLQWELENAAGRKVASDYSCMGDEVHDLPAGTYRLRVHPQNQTPGRYTLGVTNIPADASAIASLDGPPSTLTTTSPGQNGTWTFTGNAGQRVFLGFHGGTISEYDAAVTVLKPDGSTLLDRQYCGTSCTFDTTVLPVGGTYTVRFDPSGNATGALTASLLTVPADLAAAIPTNGTPSTLTTTIPGENGRWTFTGTAGQKVSFGLSGGTISQYAAHASVLKPDGSTLLNWQYCGQSCNFGVTTLPVAGTYTVLFDPDGNLTGALTASVSSLATATATVGGPAVTLTTTAPGQNGVWTFTGTAGQRVYLDLAGGAFGQYNARVSVISPDGSVFLAEQYCGTACGFDTTALPADGTYTVLVRPLSTTYGALVLRAYQVPTDAVAAISTTGTASTLTAGTPGQNGWWTFAGTAGQKVAVGLSGGTIGQYNSHASVLKSDGSVLLAGQYCGASCNFGVTTLPVAGTYTVLFDPDGNATGSLTASVSGVVTATVTVGGPAITLTTTAAGQYASWAFTGTAGQRLFADLSAGGFGQYNAEVSVLKPDGSVFLAEQYCGTSCVFDATALPVAGTYTVLLRPVSTTHGALTLRLYQVPADAGAMISTTGTASTLTAGTPGQNGRWTFSGTAGQKVAVGLSGGMISQYNSHVSVLKPDGSVLSAAQYCGASCNFGVTTLPVAGTYTVLFDPDGNATGSLTASVSGVATATATIGGPAIKLTTTAVGQNGSWTFAGTSGQRVYLDLTAGAFGQYNAEVSVLKPDGSVFLAEQYCGTSCGFDTTALPATGTYTVLLRPVSTTYGALSLRVYLVPADVTAALPTTGTASKLTITTPGQNGAWTFAGTAGKKATLTFSAGTLGQYNAEVSVLKPDGTTLVTTTYCGTSCTPAAVALPTTGTYRVVLNPLANAVGTLTATVKLA
ncbi:hypothetical protein G3I60_08940 [Streptomyces sp. SID13666]|uniref:VWD domain-containing protein n=1 Tax=unclassified Streptomyces TaxID=2593676 RepID=UPI0013C09FBC|nr:MULTISPECIES: VWD domain-containing protein [unclassified Streptomyces]NEA54273.1 hypothetical protein [Streptomyces sp. SID13666]NEA70368.1 hypothetical protein [Streptomyces sp. SID13588]